MLGFGVQLRVFMLFVDVVRGVNERNYKAVSRHIRELLEIEEPQWDRSIALPRRDMKGLFLERKSQTGRKADKLTYDLFIKEMET
ncbi:SAM15 protein, partial [Polypterus senegalus]